LISLSKTLFCFNLYNFGANIDFLNALISIFSFDSSPYLRVVICGEYMCDFLKPSKLRLNPFVDIGILLLVDSFELSIASSIDSYRAKSSSRLH
jgi:hypothetical protein